MLTKQRNLLCSKISEQRHSIYVYVEITRFYRPFAVSLHTTKLALSLPTHRSGLAQVAIDGHTLGHHFSPRHAPNYIVLSGDHHAGDEDRHLYSFVASGPSRHCTPSIESHSSLRARDCEFLLFRRTGILACISRVPSLCDQIFTLVSAASQNRSYSKSYDSTISLIPSVLRNAIHVRMTIVLHHARTVISLANLKASIHISN